MLKKKEYRFGDGDYIEIEIYQDGRYGAPGKKREPKKRPTPEQIQRQNQKNKEIRIRRYLRANFKKNDYWITGTYKKENRPASMEEAKKHLEKYRRKLRDKYRRAGAEFKYICCIEIGSRGGVHFHMVTNRIEGGDALLSECWTHGHIHLTLLYEEGGFQELAEYIGKPGEEKFYTHSRNLVFPKLRIRKIRNREWKRQPRAYKRYYVDKESVVVGYNPVTGKQYMHYAMVRFRRD